VRCNCGKLPAGELFVLIHRWHLGGIFTATNGGCLCRSRQRFIVAQRQETDCCERPVGRVRKKTCIQTAGDFGFLFAAGAKILWPLSPADQRRARMIVNVVGRGRAVGAVSCCWRLRRFYLLLACFP